MTIPQPDREQIEAAMYDLTDEIDVDGIDFKQLDDNGANRILSVLALAFEHGLDEGDLTSMPNLDSRSPNWSVLERTIDELREINTEKNGEGAADGYVTEFKIGGYRFQILLTASPDEDESDDDTDEDEDEDDVPEGVVETV